MKHKKVEIISIVFASKLPRKWSATYQYIN